MASLFPPYATFSVLALAVKCLILWRYRLLLGSYSTSFKLLFVSLFCINLAELTSFYYPKPDRGAYVLLVAYYVSALVGWATIMSISLSIAGKLPKKLGYLITSFFAVGIMTVLIPGCALDGVRHAGYTYTRIAGPYYWVFQALVLFSTFASVIVLLHSCLCDDNIGTRRKSKALLLALSPIFIVGVTVVVLMEMGIEITGTVVGSFAILSFLVTLLATENEIIMGSTSASTNHNLFRFLSGVPITSEFKLVDRVRRSVAKEHSYGLVNAVSNYERTLVREAVKLCKGNKSSAAKMLGISRTTLRRKLADQDLSFEDDGD